MAMLGAFYEHQSTYRGVFDGGELEYFQSAPQSPFLTFIMTESSIFDAAIVRAQYKRSKLTKPEQDKFEQDWDKTVSVFLFSLYPEIQWLDCPVDTGRTPIEHMEEAVGGRQAESVQSGSGSKSGCGC